MDFLASMDQIPEIMEFLRSAAEESGIEDKKRQKIELACEEAIANIISYAYPEKKGLLSVFCKKRPKKFEVLLIDYGIPFNPIDAPVNTQSNIPIDDRKIGGLGIFLLRKSIDEVTYKRDKDANILRLVFVT